MKTAVSLPDQLYAEAEKTAQRLGIPRSRLYALALEEFIEHHNSRKITERLNTVYSKINENTREDIGNSGLESLRELTKNDSW